MGIKNERAKWLWPAMMLVLSLACETSAQKPRSREPNAPHRLRYVLLADQTAQQWTRFRGPNGSGLSNATTVPVQWTADDYNWHVQLPGVGHSSPVVWGERIFLTSGDEETGRRFVVCIEAANGSQVWTREYASERHGKHKLNSFASATPAVDSDRLYVCWATPDEFIVLALDHDGKEIWRRDLGGFNAGHGFGVSPIVVDELLIVPNEQNGESALLALDRASGQIHWKVARDSKTTYSTPCVYRPAGRSPELIFTNYEHGITALDPQTGRRRWEIDVFDKSHVEAAIGSPVVAGDLVLGVCGWLGHGTEVVAVRPEPSAEEPRVEQVYRITRGAPLCTTPLVKGDLLFLWPDEGVVTCADVTTGDVHWRKRVGGNYYSSPICIGEYLYNISVEGEVVVLAASKDYRVASRNHLGEGSHSTPAVANGALYLRTFTQLFSLGGKGSFGK